MVSLISHSERYHQRIDMGIHCSACEGTGDVWEQTAPDDGYYFPCPACGGEGLDIDKANDLLADAAYADANGDRL